MSGAMALLNEVIEAKAERDGTDALVASCEMLDALDSHRERLVHIIECLAANESDTIH